MWKQATFRDLLVDKRTVPAKLGLNLVALGDQMPEIEAAEHVGQLLRDLGESSLVKTMKFKEAPTMAELLGQLARAQLELPDIVLADGSSTRSVIRQTKLYHGQQQAALSSGWRCIVREDACWRFSKKLVMKDMWPLFS